MKIAVKLANIWLAINIMIDIFMLPFSKDVLDEIKKSWNELDTQSRGLFLAVCLVILPFVWVLGFVAALPIVAVRSVLKKQPTK